MTVNKHFMPAIVIVILLGTVGLSRLTGDWIISGKQIYDTGNMTATDIKGWMTLEQVAAGLSLPIDTVYQLAGIPEDANVPPETALKDLEGLVEGFEVSGLRDAATAYLALETPAESPDATVEPIPTPAALPTTLTPAPANQSTSAVAEATATPHVPTGSGTGDGTGTGPTPLPPGDILPADQIKGRMTLREVADQCAVPLDALLTALDLPADQDPDTQLKSLVEQIPGFEVQMVQDAVGALQKQ